MFQITCGECGKTADFEAWQKTAVGMVLPNDTYQCPTCKVAIKKTFGKPTVYEATDGEPVFVVPGKCKLVRVPARL